MKKNKTFKVNKQKLQTITIGSCIMASGGGGSYQITKYKIENEFNDDCEITCVPAESLNADDWFAGAACMFPPSAMTKQTDMTTPILNVLSSMENWCRVNKNEYKRFNNFKTFEYFHPLEVGASNTAMPMIALSKYNCNQKKKKQVKVIDADTAGRSIPTLPLIIFAAYQKDKDISWFPNFVTSKTMNDNNFYSGQFNLPNGTALEEAFITLIMNQFDKCGGFSVFPMDGKTLKNHPSVYGTLTDSYNIGKIFESKKLSRQKKSEKIAEYFTENGRKSRIIFTGILKSVVLDQGGTDKEQIILEGTKSFDGEVLELGVSNENILAYKYKKGSKKTKEDIYILGPDSISYIPLDESMNVVDNSDLINYFNCPKQGEIELNILGISAAKVIRKLISSDSNNNILLKNWSKEWENVGYKGKKYIQPWLN